MKSFCYYTTPEYRNTFLGKYIFIHQSSGILELNNTNLLYTSKKNNFKLSQDEIQSIAIGRFSRWVKPIKLEFLIIKTDSSELNLIPTNTAFTPVWKINKIIEEWHNEILKFIA